MCASTAARRSPSTRWKRGRWLHPRDWQDNRRPVQQLDIMPAGDRGILVNLRLRDQRARSGDEAATSYGLELGMSLVAACAIAVIPPVVRLLVTRLQRHVRRSIAGGVGSEGERNLHRLVTRELRMRS